MNLLSFALGAGLANAIAEDEKKKMRNATPEEVKSVNDYIDNISQKVLTIPIPTNATNGDVIKALFPQAQLEEGDCIVFMLAQNFDASLIDKKWWNAPYKTESEE